MVAQSTSKKTGANGKKTLTTKKAAGSKKATTTSKIGKANPDFAEDLTATGPSKDDDPQARMVKSGLPNKSSIDKIAHKPIETRAERLERMKRDKIENDTRYRFSREKNVKQLKVPEGFKAVPWLPTDTEDNSMSISEESSDQADDTLAELEANDLMDMARNGVTYQELTGTKMVRPYNTHLIYVNKKDRDELEDDDSGSTPGEEPTEDSRNRQESIITELADFMHNQDHFEEIMKRPAGNTATIKKGAIAYELYEEDKPKTIGRNRINQPIATDPVNQDPGSGNVSAQRLLGDIARALDNVFYPENLAEQEIGSLPSESKVKLKEEATDFDIDQDLDAYILDGQPIYRTIHRHQNIYSSDEELLDSVDAKDRNIILNEQEYMVNKSLLIHQLSIRHEGNTRIDLSYQTEDGSGSKGPASARSRDSKRTTAALPSYLQEEETLESRIVMQAFDLQEKGLYKAQRRDANEHLEKYRIFRTGKFVPDPIPQKQIRQPSMRVATQPDDDRSAGTYHMTISNELQEDTTLEPTRIYLGNMEESQRQIVQLKEQEYIDELKKKNLKLSKERYLLTNDDILKLPIHKAAAFESEDVPLKEESSGEDSPDSKQSPQQLAAHQDQLRKFRLFAQGEFEQDPEFEPVAVITAKSVNFDKLDERDPRFAGIVPREDDSVYGRAIHPETKRVIPVLAPKNQEEFREDLKLYQIGVFEPDLPPNISFASSNDNTRKPGKKEEGSLEEEESLNATYHLLKNIGNEDMVEMKQQQDQFREGLKKYKVGTMGALPNNIKLDFTRENDDSNAGPKDVNPSKTQGDPYMVQEESSAENTFLHMRKYKVTDAAAFKENQKRVKESLEKLGLNLEAAEALPPPPPDLAGLKDTHSDLLAEGGALKEDSSMDTFDLMKNIAGETDLYTFKKTQAKMRQDLGGLQVAVIPGEFINPPPKLLDLSLGKIPEPKEGEESKLSEELSRLGLKEEDTIQDEMELLRKMKIKDLYLVRGRVAKYKQELKDYEFKTVELDPRPQRIPNRKWKAGLANLSLDESKLSKQGIREESSLENTFVMMQRRNLQDVAKVHQMQDKYRAEMAKMGMGLVRVEPTPAKPVIIDFSESNSHSSPGRFAPNEESTLQSQILMRQLGAKDKFELRLQQNNYEKMLLDNQVFFIQDHLVSEKLKDLSYDFKSAEITQPLDEEESEVSKLGKHKTADDDMKKIAANEELKKLGINKLENQDPDQSWSIANFVEFHNYKRQFRIWKNRELDLLRRNEREVEQQKIRTSRSLDLSNDVSYGILGRPFTKPKRFVPISDDSKLQKSRMRLSTPQGNSLAPINPVNQAQNAQPAKKADISQEGFFKIVSAPPNESFEYNDYREAIDPRQKPVSTAAKTALNPNLQSPNTAANAAQPQQDNNSRTANTQQQQTDEPKNNKQKSRNMWALHEEFDDKRQRVVDQARQKVRPKRARDENGNKLYKDTPLQRIVVKMRRLNGGDGEASGLSVIQEGPGNDEVEDLDLVIGPSQTSKQPRIKKQNQAQTKMGDTTGSKIFGDGFDESSIGMGLTGNGKQDEEGKSFLQDSMFIDLLGQKSIPKQKVTPDPIQQPQKMNKPIREPSPPKLNKLNKPAYDHFEADLILPGKKQREVNFIPEPVIKSNQTKYKPKTDEPSNNPVLFGNSPNTTNDLGRLGRGIDLGAGGQGDWNTKKEPVKVKRQDDEYQPMAYSQKVATRPNIYVKGGKNNEDSVANDKESVQMPYGPEADDGEFDLQAEIRRNAFGSL